MGTLDMYNSPYFGQLTSGSSGSAQDAAYRKYKGIAEPTPNPMFQGPGLGSPQTASGPGGLGGLLGGARESSYGSSERDSFGSGGGGYDAFVGYRNDSTGPR